MVKKLKNFFREHWVLGSIWTGEHLVLGSIWFWGAFGRGAFGPGSIWFWGAFGPGSICRGAFGREHFFGEHLDLHLFIETIYLDTHSSEIRGLLSTFNALEKRFKICHIFMIRKPMY